MKILIHVFSTDVSKYNLHPKFLTLEEEATDNSSRRKEKLVKKLAIGQGKLQKIEKKEKSADTEGNFHS